MQSKVLLNRLKKLERKKDRNKYPFVFFGMPSRADLARMPPGARVIIFTDEDKIQD